MLSSLNYFATDMFGSSIINSPSLLARNLANLYVVACMLFTTGWIGLFSSCILILALSVGDIGCIWVRYFHLLFVAIKSSMKN